MFTDTVRLCAMNMYPHDIDSLPPPDEIAAEIVENLRVALDAFESVSDELSKTDD